MYALKNVLKIQICMLVPNGLNNNPNSKTYYI